MNYFLLFMLIAIVPLAARSLFFLAFGLIITVILVVRCRRKVLYLFIFLAAFGGRFILLECYGPSSHNGVVLVSETKSNYYLVEALSGRYYVYEKAHQKEIGDLLYVTSNVAKMVSYPLESQFDFVSYLQDRGVKGELEVKEEKWLWRIPFRRNTLKTRWERQFDVQTMDLLSGFFFGERRDSALTYETSSLHFYLLLGGSGFHFGFLRRGLEKLFIRFRFKRSRFFSFAALLPFVLLRPSYLLWKRWLIYEGIRAFNHIRQAPPRPMRDLSLTGLILLAVDPYLALQQGFQISFSVLFFYQWINQIDFRVHRWRRIASFALIQLIFLLFEGYYQHEINLLTPLLALLSPLILLFFSGFAFLLFLPFAFPLMKWSDLYIRLVKVLSSWHVILPCGEWSSALLVIFLLALIIIIYLAQKKIKPLLKTALVLFAGSMIFTIAPRVWPDEQFVSFLNVGQGDAIFIKSGLKSLLIDTGGLVGRDIAQECLIPFLRRQKVYRLDYVIITHHDYDHIGGVDTLKEAGYIKNLISDDSIFPLSWAGLYLEQLNLWRAQMTSENDRSLVLSFHMGSRRFLLMGDAEVAVENRLLSSGLEMKSTVLKVGHHGSKTSSSMAFLAKVQPQEAIISCGYQNRYGHPHTEVVERLEKLKTRIRRTDEEGTITYRSSSRFTFKMSMYLWYTENERRRWQCSIFSMERRVSF